MTTPALQNLIVRLRAAKLNEATYKAERLEIEAALVALVGVKSQGQKTTHDGDYRIVTKPNYGYSIDMEKWATIADKFPEALAPFKMVLDETKLKNLRVTHPDAYIDLAFAVTVTPNKPSLTVTEAAA
ncbi:MAG: hypothetical protein WKG03_00425 [Telluria sp.]